MELKRSGEKPKKGVLRAAHTRTSFQVSTPWSMIPSPAVAQPLFLTYIMSIFVSPELSSGRDLVIQMSVRRVPSAIFFPYYGPG